MQINELAQQKTYAQPDCERIRRAQKQENDDRHIECVRATEKEKNVKSN